MANVSGQGAGGLFGTLTVYGGGGSAVAARDAIDLARMGAPTYTPESSYPDGYLGASNGRREGRLENTQGNLNQRPYTRGVHRGERIDTQDYFWPSDQRPDRGLQFQAAGLKTPLAGPGAVLNAPLVAGGRDLPQPPMPATPDPHFSSQHRGLLPPWR